MSMTTAQAQTILNDYFAPWVKALELTVDEITPSGATLSMPVTPALARVGGIVSGQALAAMADTAMVFAAIGHYQAPAPVATTNLDVQFLRPGHGERIRCDAEIVRAGKALLFTRATMVALPADKAVATATATFYHP
jgi:uncharacterized protein (TIGR00369 family)